MVTADGRSTAGVARLIHAPAAAAVPRFWSSGATSGQRAQHAIATVKVSLTVRGDPRLRILTSLRARTAMARAPWALVHEGDFFAWASETVERFECSAGNPPFIRYQTFKGTTRARAIELCARLGADFSGLASFWAPFLVATAAC
jgi:hypothetical protein